MNKSETFLLTDLEISFVSACPQGANPGAKVMLKKEIVSMKTAIKKEKDGKDPVNVTIDIEALSKSMTDSLGKVMADLMAKDKDLSAEAMTDAVVAVLTGDIAKVGKDINDQVSKAIADVQKEFNDKMAKAKSDAEDVSKSGEETVTVNGVTFKKSAVGDAVFQVMKAAEQQQDDLRKEIAFEKAVARVEKEYPNVTGAPADKASLLVYLEKADEKTRDLGLAVLKALNESSEEFKKEHGKSTGTDSKDTMVGKMSTDTDASAKLDKLAKDLASKEGIPFASAYAKVLDTPEGEELYNAHVNSRG